MSPTSSSDLDLDRKIREAEKQADQCSQHLSHLDHEISQLKASVSQVQSELLDVLAQKQQQKNMQQQQEMQNQTQPQLLTIPQDVQAKLQTKYENLTHDRFLKSAGANLKQIDAFLHTLPWASDATTSTTTTHQHRRFADKLAQLQQQLAHFHELDAKDREEQQVEKQASNALARLIPDIFKKATAFISGGGVAP